MNAMCAMKVSGKPFGRDRRIVQLIWMMMVALLVHYQVNNNNNV